jgi:ribonuclease BN (tRNA processing enzyme)
MRVICLGSGDVFGSKGKLNTSFYFNASKKGVLIDCGATTPVALKKVRLSANDVDVILVSHLHGDHVGGIPFIITERQVKGDPDHTLTVIGPEGIKASVMKVLSIFFQGIGENLRFPLDFIEYQSGECLRHDDLLTLTPYEAVHAPATNPHSLRIEVNGKIIAYSGDTQWNENLISLSKNADLFICEGHAFNKPESHHMSIKELVHNRDKLTAKKIILTHMSEEALESGDQIPFEFAQDGEIIIL